jgi:hypothetical protein
MVPQYDCFIDMMVVVVCIELLYCATPDSFQLLRTFCLLMLQASAQMGFLSIDLWSDLLLNAYFGWVGVEDFLRCVCMCMCMCVCVCVCVCVCPLTL